MSTIIQIFNLPNDILEIKKEYAKIENQNILINEKLKEQNILMNEILKTQNILINEQNKKIAELHEKIDVLFLYTKYIYNVI